MRARMPPGVLPMIDREPDANPHAARSLPFDLEKENMYSKWKTLGSAIAAVACCWLSSAHAVSTDHPSVTRALALVKQHAVAANAADADQYLARQTVIDPDGSEHVRFDRKHKGLRVIGGDFVVHSNNRGQLTQLSGTMKNALQVDVRPGIDRRRAIAIAEQLFTGQRHEASEAELVVYALQAPVLAYEVRVRGELANGSPSAMHYFLDATTGSVLDQWDGIETAGPVETVDAIGTARTLLNGQVRINTDQRSAHGSYYLTDLTRGGNHVNDMSFRTRGVGKLMKDADNLWGNSTVSNVATVAGDVAYGTATTWDYYLKVHGRQGIADDGKGSYGRIHYSTGYNNAYWSDDCFCMTFGDGDGVTFRPLVALDVVGHEMSHGVTSRTANLNYSNESGALNEATSDIFGTLIEFFANNPASPGNYLIGERVTLQDQALRYMFKPSLDGASPDCYRSGIGRLDVHLSSAIANHFAYLLAEGAVVPRGFNLTPGQLVCNGDTGLTGIGRDALGQIWYRALTVYMTSGTTYAGARAATLSAASDLYGIGSAEYAAVSRAWYAVDVN